METNNETSEHHDVATVTPEKKGVSGSRITIIILSIALFLVTVGAGAYIALQHFAGSIVEDTSTTQPDDDNDTETETDESGRVVLRQKSTKGGPVSIYQPFGFGATATYPEGWSANREIEMYGDGIELFDEGTCGGLIPLTTTVDFTSPSGDVTARALATNTSPGCLGTGLSQVVKVANYYDMPDYANHEFVELIVQETECYDSGEAGYDHAACLQEKAKDSYLVFASMVVAGDERYVVGEDVDATLLTFLYAGQRDKEKFFIFFPRDLADEHILAGGKFGTLEEAQTAIEAEDYKTARSIITTTNKQ